MGASLGEKLSLDSTSSSITTATAGPTCFTGWRIFTLTMVAVAGLFERVIDLKGAEKILHPSPSGDHWDYRTLADVDGDGNFDILLGDHQGFVWFHRNLRTNDSPQMDVAGVKLLLNDGKPVRVGMPPPDVRRSTSCRARTAVTWRFQ